MNSRSKLVRGAREGALWLGASLGVLCLVLGALALVLDVRPLVFKSGSMSPEIEAGALALAREVPASELAVGDVVSVTSERHVRITHRIVSVETTEAGTVLRLKGDANDAPDAESYQVDDAYRVFADVPYAGYAVNAASTPWGLLICGGFVTLLLVSAFGGRGGAIKRPNPPGRHPAGRHTTRVVAGAATAGLLVTSAAGVAPIKTVAAFSDSSVVTGGVLTSLTVPPPTSPTCVTNGVLLTTATIGWTSSGPNYSYRLDVRRAGETVIQQTNITTGTNFTYSVTLLSGLLSSSLVVTVRAFPTGSPTWLSSGSVTKNLRVKTLALGVECRA